MRSLTFLLLLFSLVSRAGELEIKTNQPAKKITITGYSGLKEQKIADLFTDSTGFAKHSGDYQGFLLLDIENTGVFPVILHDRPVAFSLDQTGDLHFSDPENTWFYEALKREKTSDQQKRTLQEKQKELDQTNREHEKHFPGETGPMAAILLQGQLLIESACAIHTKEALTEGKQAMLGFLSLHFIDLFHSDMFRQMAFQYVMMNEYVAQSQDEHWRLVLSDIHDWINEFRGRLSPEEITGFFVEMAVGRRMISLAGEIMCEFSAYTGCPVGPGHETGQADPHELMLHVWKSGDAAIPISQTGTGKKLLIFFDEDCVFCLPGHVRMMKLIEKNGLSLPVITVFSGKKSPHELEELALPRKFTYWLYDGPAYGSKVCNIPGVQKYPAFVILDPAHPGAEVFYSSDEVIRSLISAKTAR